MVYRAKGSWKGLFAYVVLCPSHASEPQALHAFSVQEALHKALGRGVVLFDRLACLLVSHGQRTTRGIIFAGGSWLLLMFGRLFVFGFGVSFVQHLEVGSL